MEYRLGIDIGSTTIKAVLLDGNDAILYSRYRRHRSDVSKEMALLFDEIAEDLPEITATVRMTGSAGLGAATALNLPFMQEVAAGTRAVHRFVPGADVVIELGGEDAKITFMKPVVSQRMNGTCAGGTGAFIDQMAALLQTDAAGLNKLAKEYTSLYSIASRCGVFAKSDMQPLLNEGAGHADLAASVLQAVVNQTIAGLACGQPITGRVVFLGGPLTYMSELRGAFERTLADAGCEFVTPRHAEIFIALGAALGSDGEPMLLSELPGRLQNAGAIDADIPRMEPLFASKEELQDFQSRHARARALRGDISGAEGPCFLGVDAGSTTIKAVLTERDGQILYTYYSKNEGAPLPRAAEALREIYQNLPPKAYVGGVTVTGYGEQLLKTALRADRGEIETVCHTRAAQAFAPDVDFILDIGGQDMKCLRIRDGLLDSVLLNEACSSGCGSFVQTFAEALGLSVADFAVRALDAERPVDLGTRCTVFMNSRVKQAQKEGASIGDISCGLSYSVVRNALFKVIKLQSPEQMGKTILVQGGTFYNDAILRCFERVAGVEVIRPDVAGLMGAYGAALIASDSYTAGARSSVIAADSLDEIQPQKVAQVACMACTNACKLTVSTFAGGRRLISGFRCEKGEGKSADSGLPNLMEEKYDRLFSYKPLDPDKAPNGCIGLPRALNMYENYPLWHTFFTELGFSAVLSRGSDHTLFEEGMSTIPSESICYPAKLAHGHIHDLLKRGVKTVFYPCVTYERKENEAAGNYYNCPIVQSYPEVIDANMDILKKSGAVLLKPFLSLMHKDKMAKTLTKMLSPWKIPHGKVKRALDLGFAEMDSFRAFLAKRGEETVRWLERTGGTGVVLAGRPYHADPEIHHGLPRMVASLGFAVLTEDSVAHLAPVQRPLRIFDQWMYHTRLYDAAAYVAAHPNLQMVQLNSFGCGLDAVTTDQVQEILSSAGKIYTALKIDEINSLGAARIRMRSLAAALSGRLRRGAAPAGMPYTFVRKEFTQKMKKKHTILAPQMSPVHFELLEALFRHDGYDFHILKTVDHQDIEMGLRFVNNDACYPTIVVIGQLMRAMLSGEYDPDNTSVFLTQTGGGCRATNYVALLRRALREAGLGQVTVVALSLGGIEKNSGIKWTIPMIDGALKSFVLGDLLQNVLLRTRPYEKEEGSANALYRKWLDGCVEMFLKNGGLNLSRTAERIVADFEALPFKDIPRKPRVGLVGEILVKFHPDANNNAVAVIEREGFEAVVPGIVGFFQYIFLNGVVKHDILGTSGVTAAMMNLAIRLVYRYENAVKKWLRASSRFTPEASIHELAEKASHVLSIANQCGEGWLLTAEMIELIEQNVPNIICAQPFACLPNHVTGKGMIRKLRELFPQSNIVPIDYDPGASEVNQLNRIKLMLSAAAAGGDFACEKQ
ncbi:MAG: 2-hydroxyacyl-CoA dehydratase [Oscillospiraceae bacterium]|jgi:predicted CoA-substrate-specific enzyme activase|nr:2-hydroxyacyl-CoA dehydratase [Oscillospiraceae bacterium]